MKSIFEQVVPLILLQDYCYTISATLKNLKEFDIKNVVILNTAKEKSQQDLKDLCELYSLKMFYKESEFTTYSEARNTLIKFADSTFKKKDKIIYLITDPGDMLEIPDSNLAEKTLNAMFSLWCNNEIVLIQQKWIDLGTVKTQKWYLPKLFLSHQDIKYQGYAHEFIDIRKCNSRTDDIIQYQIRPDIGLYDEEKIIKKEITDETEIKFFHCFKKRCETNIRLLEQELKDIDKSYSHIKNKTKRYNSKKQDSYYARTLFYLAQDYGLQLNNYFKALKLYTRRAEIPVHKEEQFEAAKRSLEILLFFYKQVIYFEDNLKLDKLIRHWFKKSIEIPVDNKAEVYYIYINYLLYGNHELRYSKLDKNDAIQKRNDDIAQAHKYLETLINLAYPSNAILFVQENVYNQDRFELYKKIFPPKFEKPEVCVICYESTELESLIPCSHWLCKDCIKKIDDQCFFCRRKVQKVLKPLLNCTSGDDPIVS